MCHQTISCHFFFFFLQPFPSHQRRHTQTSINNTRSSISVNRCTFLHNVSPFSAMICRLWLNKQVFHNLTYLRNAKAASEWEVMEGMGRGAKGGGGGGGSGGRGERDGWQASGLTKWKKRKKKESVRWRRRARRGEKSVDRLPATHPF